MGDEEDHSQIELDVLDWVELPKGKDAEPVGLKSAYEVAEEHGVRLKVLKEYVEDELERSAACWGLPFTLLLVISYCLVALQHDNAPLVRSVEDSLKYDVEGSMLFTYIGPYAGHKNILDIDSVDEFWSWMNRGLLPVVFAHEHQFAEGYDESDPRYIRAANQTYDKGLWLNFNRVVGGIRMQQERSGDDKKEKECGSIKILRAFYGMDCVAGHGYELDPEMRGARTTTDPQNTVWLYLYQGMDSLKASVWELEKTRWFDRQTKKIEIAIPIFNGELGIHTLMYVNFFVSRGGGMWKRLIPLSAFAEWFPKWYYWFWDVLWLTCVLYILVTEIWEAFQIIRAHGVGGIWSEYLGVWNCVDWASMICAFAVMIMFVIATQLTTDTNNAMANIPGFTAEPAAQESAIGVYLSKLEEAVQYGHQLRLAVAAYPLMIIIRLFKAFGAQPRLALVTDTLASATSDLLHFLIVFSSIFVTFVISGSILYGREVMAFGTFPRAVSTCFRMMYGDFMWDELRVIGVREATVWLVLFIVVVIMVLLNMLIAIIMDHYISVKSLARDSENLWQAAVKSYYQFRDVRSGLCVPLHYVEGALAKEAKERLKALPKPGVVRVGTTSSISHKMGTSQSDDALEEDDGQLRVLVPADLQTLYSEYKPSGKKHTVMSELQATHLIAGAILSYYKKNNSKVDIDEVAWLTRKVEYRTKKLAKMGKLQELTDKPNEVAELRKLKDELAEFTDELREERDANQREMEELRGVKRVLLQQLALRQQPHGPDAGATTSTAEASGGNGTLTGTAASAARAFAATLAPARDKIDNSMRQSELHATQAQPASGGRQKSMSGHSREYKADQPDDAGELDLTI